MPIGEYPRWALLFYMPRRSLRHYIKNALPLPVLCGSDRPKFV